MAAVLTKNVVVHLPFWWMYNTMGSLKKFNLVVLWTTLGNCVNMQISAPLLKHLFSSISSQLRIISSPTLCIHICSHGKKMLSYEYAYMCMQIRTAIIEKPHFFNIWKTMHDNIMKMVSIHMFPRSRIIIMSLTMS